jgi:hypothetical protein
MQQSRAMSLLETGLSTGIGLGVALGTQLIVFPWFGFSPPLTTNMLITGIFTVVSIARQFLVRRLFEALHIRHKLSPFAQAVIAERQRQIDGEGYDAAHDDAHKPGEMARAGACYLGNAAIANRTPTHAPPWWPWSPEWWNPKDTRRDLIRGCALGLAEGDRFDRARRKR